MPTRVIRASVIERIMSVLQPRNGDFRVTRVTGIHGYLDTIVKTSRDIRVIIRGIVRCVRTVGSLLFRIGRNTVMGDIRAIRDSTRSIRDIRVIASYSCCQRDRDHRVTRVTHASLFFSLANDM